MKKYIFIPTLFLCISCVDFNTSQLNYHKDLSLFPEYIVDLFPNNLSKIHLTSKNVDITNGCIFYFNYSFFCDSIKEIQQNI